MRSPAAHDDLLAIGYGNALRGDDAAGPAVARRLKECGFAAIEAHQLTPELAEPVSAARAVFFLDADAALPPGEISVEAVEADRSKALPPIEHHVAPAILLRLARDVYGTAPGAWLVRLGVAGFTVGAALSPAAERSIGRAVDQVLRIGEHVGLPAG